MVVENSVFCLRLSLFLETAKHTIAAKNHAYTPISLQLHHGLIEHQHPRNYCSFYAQGLPPDVFPLHIDVRYAHSHAINADV